MVNKYSTGLPTKYKYFFLHDWETEDDLPRTPRQSILAQYLKSVLELKFRNKPCFIVGNVNIYLHGKFEERIAPDLMIVKDVMLTDAEIDKLEHWEVNSPTRPAPNVVFEISDTHTWEIDILPENKPLDYKNLGVKEYFVYDPKGVWADKSTNLIGFRYVNGTTVAIKPNQQGWLWSNELNSWLVPDEVYLRLYAKEYKPVLTEAETYQQELEKEQQTRLALEQQITELQAKLKSLE
jgi:Uma2 family endonuclease